MENTAFEEAKLQEYLMLRSEMMDEIRAQETLFTICLTSVSAILAFAFSQHLSLILLAAHPVIYFLLAMYKRHRERVTDIAGYLIVFLEPVVHISWETIAHSHRSLTLSRSKKIFWTTPHYHFWGFLSFLSFLSSIILDGISQFSVYPLWLYGITYFLHLLFLIVIYRSSAKLSRVTQMREASVKNWEKIKSKMNSHGMENTDHKSA